MLIVADVFCMDHFSPIVVAVCPQGDVHVNSTVAKAMGHGERQ